MSTLVLADFPVYVLGSLIISLIVFHIMWIVWKPKSRIFWRAMDYVWFGTGAITVCLIAFAVSEDEVRRERAFYAERLAFVQAPIKHEFRRLAASRCADGVVDEKLGEDREVLCPYVKRFDELLWREGFTSMTTKQLTANFPWSVKGEYAKEFGQYVKREADYIAMQAGRANQPDPNEDTRRWLALRLLPLLLPIVLALRITKVTAELLDEKKKFVAGPA